MGNTKKEQPIICETEGLRAECRSESIVLTWRALTEYASEEDPVIYQVYYKVKDSEESWQTMQTEESDIELTGLLPDTEYSVAVRAYNDASGHLGSFPENDEYLVARTALPLDEEAPTVATTELIVAKRTKTTLTVRWESASDNETESSQIRYEVYLDGALKKDEVDINSYTFRGLTPNKQYTVSVKAYDEAGNVLVYPDFLTKTLDDRAPVVGNPNLTVTSCNTDSISIQWDPASDNDTEAGQIRYEVYLNGMRDRDEKGITSHTFSKLVPNTVYTFSVKAFDEAGNALTYVETSGKTLDDKAPTVVSPNLTVTSRKTDSISIQWKAASDNDTAADQIRYEVYLNGKLQKKENGITSYTFTGLTPNTLYTFCVKAFDVSGNELPYSPVSVKTLDDKAPTVGNRSITFSDIKRDGFKVSWNAASDNDTAASQIRYEVYLNGELKKKEKNITSFVFTGLASYTQYNVAVKAFDEAGNALQYIDASVRTLDNKAPTVGNSSITVSDRRTNSISIKWNAASDNDTAASQIRYEVYLNGALKKNDKNFNSHTFTGLTPNTLYSFYVKAFDAADNALVYPTATVRTLDNQPPTVSDKSITISNITRNSFKATWKAAGDNDTSSSAIRYQVYLFVGGTWILKNEANGITSHIFTGLTPNTQYYVRVYALDASNNQLSYPSAGGSTSAKTLDDKAPTVGNSCISTVDRKTNSLTINWNAASDNDTATSQIRYEVYLNGSLKKSDKNFTSHTFTGLTPNTSYSFYVKAFDAAGNVLTYSTSSAKTKDDKAPTVGNSAITISNRTPNSFKASWNPASDNDTASGSIRYQVLLHIGGKWEVKQDACGITSYTFTGLTPNTSYCVCVFAFDASGNRFTYPSSSSSTPASTTPARVNRLAVSVRQGASVLYGTNTICLDLQYTFVHYDANGNVTGRQSGHWQRKWSNKDTANTVIQLPADWYFENNRVYIYIDSRKAASAGLNKWKKCSDGYLDISSGNLILQLSGSYYSHSVRFTKL